MFFKSTLNGYLKAVNVIVDSTYFTMYVVPKKHFFKLKSEPEKETRSRRVMNK